MKDWFLSREPRERVILAVGALAAVVLISWQFLWQPLAGGTQALREEVARKDRFLVELQQAAAVAPREAAGSRPASTQSLVVLVDRTAQSHGLAGALTRSQPDGRDAINVYFQNASFDALVTWLVALQEQHGIAVASAAVNRTQQPGLVNGQIFLRRS